MNPPATPSRDDLLLQYLDTLPFSPYPVQEEALMAYFSSDQGVLVCAPTGTGKTLIAEAALYEALFTGREAYYTTPLIALTEQKFAEIQDAAERWGFSRDQVGLVTGNRSVNAHAPIKVVVAEILFNRLLHAEEFRFERVGAVVMDEFHAFSDPERGIVWELSLSLLPKHVRLMLLSATIGNAGNFLAWLRRSHQRDLALVQGTERKVPLTYHWENELLPDLLVEMAKGDESTRKTPALVFCFDREKCWATADLLRGRDMLSGDQQARLAERLDTADLSGGAGPRLKRLLMRGVGIHHAGLLPKHRRLVEELFQEKLLSICVCTETLAAGMNLPARSVVLTDLLKGPRDKKKLIAPSSAQQMFGRAGRPQFDTEGHVYAVAHEDDVKILRHKEKIDQIPEDTKDPGLMTMRKKLIKKMPTRRAGVQYPSEAQFEKLQTATPGNLESRSHLPWRLLAFLLDASPDVSPLRAAVAKRLMTDAQITAGQEQLTRMLVCLHEQGFVTLDPAPPPPLPEGETEKAPPLKHPVSQEPDRKTGLMLGGSLGELSLGSLTLGGLPTAGAAKAKPTASVSATGPAPTAAVPTAASYEPLRATPTERLADLLVFRAVQPVYGAFLLDYLGMADRHERLQILESMLEVPGSVARQVRVPMPSELPPGELATGVVDPALLTSGLLTQDDLYPPPPSEQERPFGEAPKFPVPLGEKMFLLFQSRVRHGGHVPVTPVWIAGDLLAMGASFEKYIQVRDLAKQEGVIFRHLLRLILLCEEFMQVTPRGLDRDVWRMELKELAAELTIRCREVDPASTDEILTQEGRSGAQSA